MLFLVYNIRNQRHDFKFEVHIFRKQCVANTQNSKSSNSTLWPYNLKSMTFKVPAPKENLISTPRTRSYLRKKTFMYMYVHAKQYTGYNIYWSCIRRKKGYILGKPNWDSVRYYAFNAQVDFILLLIYFWLELFFFGKKNFCHQE